MALAFSPIAEDVLSAVPRQLLPRHAFLMRQLGAPPALDQRMASIAEEVLRHHAITPIDATFSTGRRDYLERILGLIRCTGFAVAVFSGETRQTAFANIALELGFAAMCGKPLMILKSKEADPPSDLKRTDWIEFDLEDEAAFRDGISRAVLEIGQIADFERDKLELALAAEAMDCAVAFERLQRAYLLSGDATLIGSAEQILSRLRPASRAVPVSDLERLEEEIGLFVRNARRNHSDRPA